MFFFISGRGKKGMFFPTLFQNRKNEKTFFAFFVTPMSYKCYISGRFQGRNATPLSYDVTFFAPPLFL